ncbi:endospore germination permease [Paenibacillus sacheonensis]|uniref:Endospore germination permease n=1 Tax=Paenibacillus sacheonensis TaxID=742054 RepID=A0A7X4YSV3_9BACL|nr:endospore germination permease [Paenibacillus sacheonensis]MBM7567156.1 spore germination protein (amino acid permease) [Paenibacillus sacheonensis]NBC70919.1 endospore germination permease [Paenibacillus sacheonensis]
MTTKINAFQLAALLVTFIGISNHVIMIPILLDTAKRDAWISVLAAIVPSVLLGLLCVYIYNRIPSSLSTWVDKKSALLWLPFTLLFTVYFSAQASISIRDTIVWSNTTYLTYTPPSVVGICLLGICYYTARKGLAAIAITNGMLLPWIVLFGFYVMIVDFGVKDYSYLFPVFKNSAQAITKGAWYTASGITEIFLVLFLKDDIKGKLSGKSMLPVVLILIELTLGPLSGIIAMFGPFEAELLRYPAYEQWRMASIGSMLSQTDFLSIYQWLAGSFIRISLAIHIIRTLWVKKWRHPEILLILITLFLFVVNQIKLSDVKFHEHVKMYYTSSSLICGATSIVLLICIWAGKNKKAVKPSG